jgi:hypothetical protein
MKPVLTRGGRGARILTKENLANALINEKPGFLEANYGEVFRTLSGLHEGEFRAYLNGVSAGYYLQR